MHLPACLDSAALPSAKIHVSFTRWRQWTWGTLRMRYWTNLLFSLALEFLQDRGSVRNTYIYSHSMTEIRTTENTSAGNAPGHAF